MTTYTLSNGGQTVDQTALGIPGGSQIIGGTGNDTITIAWGTAVPGGGNNTVIGTSVSSQLAYYGAPAGIIANLQTGIISNGYGGTDTVSGIGQLSGSSHSDQITSSRGAVTFFGSGGDDTYWGNGGIATVDYYGDKSSQASVNYDAKTDTWTVVKNFNGATSTDTLHNVAIVKFDDKTYTTPSYQTITVPDGTYVMGVEPFVGPGGEHYVLVMRTIPSGGTEVPVQMLRYDQAAGQFVDVTSSAISGPVPTADNTRNITAIDLNGDGILDFVLANQGRDAPPFPGTTDTVLLSTADGHWVDATSAMPSSLADTHDISSGVIDHKGTVGIFANVINSPVRNGPYYLIDSGNGKLVESSATMLPPSLQISNNISSVMTDVNGDGAADLVVGTLDATRTLSYVYLNPGNGDFSKAVPILLPASPLPKTPGLYSSDLGGPSILDIQAIHIASSTSEDLVVVSTNGNYSGYAIQLLINDGAGHFTDQTSSRLFGAPSWATVKTTVATGLTRAIVADFNGDGVSDIVTEGDGIVPSQVFLSDGHGHFNLAYSTTAAQVQGVMNVSGTANLIEMINLGGSEVIHLVPYQALPVLNQQTPTQSWQQGSVVSMSLPAGTFTDPSGQTLSYSATQADGSALPSWLSIDPATGTLSGTAPTGSQSLSLVVTATDTSGFLAEDSFTANLVLGASQALSSFTAGTLTSAASVTDSVANIAASLNGLQTLAAAGKLTSIALTDGGIPNLSVTPQQLSADGQVIAKIGGFFDVAITADTTSETITGVAGHGNTVIFKGNAVQWTVTPSGDGSAFTISNGTATDHVSGVTALQFGDYTDFVASQTPAVAGAVSSAEVTDLYAAVFGRTPDVPGLAYYEATAAANPSLPITTFAQWFLQSPEYTGNSAHNYAQSTAGDAQFITDTYSNLLHRGPGTGDVAWYQANVITPILGSAAPGSAAYTSAELAAHAALLADFSASAEFLGDVQITSQHKADAQHWLILI